MEWVKNEKIPVKSWCSEIESSAWAQIINLTLLPYVYKHIAIMPDCHCGYGMPIGGVVALDGVVSPNMVGVDIGCGMCAVETDVNISEVDEETLKAIIGRVREEIPVGFNHRDDPVNHPMFDDPSDHVKPVKDELSNAKYQMGTLGGGNHFIEVQRNEDGTIWLMLHSGSRNFGFKIAKYFNNRAKELCKRWHTKLPDRDLAFIPLGESDAGLYIDGMNYALEFAKANREHMMNIFKSIVFENTECDFKREINIHHNYAALENHFGKNVWVHRKGATSANKGEYGIIPGSQGTPSYIVIGLGNPDSFKSCSHGAGRKMGRADAKRTLDLETEQKCLEDAGVLHSIRGVGDLDEAPSAYKDIEEVIESQKDLVEVAEKLYPLAVVKG